MAEQNSPEIAAALRNAIEGLLRSSKALTKKDIERKVRATHPGLPFNRSLMTKVLNDHFKQLPSTHRFFPIPEWTTRDDEARDGGAQPSGVPARRPPSEDGDSAAADPKGVGGPSEELLSDEDEGPAGVGRPQDDDDIRLQREQREALERMPERTDLDDEGAAYKKGIDHNSPMQRLRDETVGRLKGEQSKYIDSD